MMALIRLQNVVSAEEQRQNAADLLRLAAFRVLEGLPACEVDTLVHRAVAYVAVAEHAEQEGR